MHPIVSLNSEKIKELYFQVLKGARLDSMFVLPWLTDARPIWNSTVGLEIMKTFIENPYNNGKPISLIDSTQLFKNFYNNFPRWENNANLCDIACDHFHISGKNCKNTFQHRIKNMLMRLIQVYDLRKSGQVPTSCVGSEFHFF